MSLVRSLKALVALTMLAASVVATPSIAATPPTPAVLRSTDAGWPAFSARTDEITVPEDGIGPGTRLRITVPEGRVFGCTANFLWRDQADLLYLGTAGHCLLPEGTSTTHGPNADYDPSGVLVEALIPACPHDPGFRVEPAGLVCDEWVTLGSVAYAAQGAVGTDFGLVRLPAELASMLRAEMPRWGGPHTSGRVTVGEQLFHFGHGVGTGTLFASRARTGVAVLTDEGLVTTVDAFAAAGLIAAGDSGSPLTAGLQLVDGNPASSEAVGVLTHSLPGTMYGTPVHRAQELARDAGLEIRVVTVDEAI